VTPAAMMFSKCFLRRKYSIPHLIGVLLCITGAVLNVFQDRRDDKDDKDEANGDMKYKMFGDLLAVAASTLYGLEDILCEYTLDEYDGGAYEYLGASAFFAATFAFVPALVWEWDQITTLSPAALADLVSLMLVDAGSYFFTSKFLEYSESALKNLSALTENIWAILFSIVLKKTIPAAFFFVGLFLTMTGMVIYETSPSPIVLITDNKDKIEMANMQYKTISREIENEDTTTCTIGTDQSTSLDEGDGSDTSIC